MCIAMATASVAKTFTMSSDWVWRSYSPTNFIREEIETSGAYIAHGRYQKCIQNCGQKWPGQYERTGELIALVGRHILQATFFPFLLLFIKLKLASVALLLLFQ
jgi:hypothetical protein